MNRKNYKSTSTLSMIAVIITALILFFGCTKKESTTKKEPKEIKIGVVGPFTGEGATYGESMRRGFELALPKDGAIKLVYEDDKLLASEGVAAINRLIATENVKVVLGSAASGVTLAMVPIADKHKVILFSSISTSDDLSKSGDFFFRNVPRNEIQGKTAARYVMEKQKKATAVILKKNDEYATNLSKSFKAKFEELGGKILLEEAYEPGTNDFRGIISKFKGIRPEVAYIPGNYQEVAIFLKQAYELGLKVVFIGGDGSYSPQLIEIAGNSAEGSCYTMMGVRHDAYYNNFKTSFVARYKKEPDTYDAYAYEAASIVFMAVREVGNDSIKIRNYLLTHSFDSLTGTLKFESNGDVEREYCIVKVDKGQFKEVE